MYNRSFSSLIADSEPGACIENTKKKSKKLNSQKTMNYKRFFFVFLVTMSISLSYLFAGDETVSNEKTFAESSKWFRKYGDYLVYLTVQRASTRGYSMSVFSDKTAFETSIAKRLRIGSPSDNFHWGIEFGLFTSLNRHNVWNFTNLCVEGKLGFFGLIDLKPAVLLVELTHYCSNLLQGAPEFRDPIKYSQYGFYHQLFYPASMESIPGLKFIKLYYGAGVYFYQYPKSHHIPFDLGIEIESKSFLSSNKGIHLGIHMSYTGMRNLTPTRSVMFGWGALSDPSLSSLPFSIGVFYQWGQDARGQYFEEDRKIFGIRFNIMY
jgi:hypothetical protein